MLPSTYRTILNVARGSIEVVNVFEGHRDIGAFFRQDPTDGSDT